MPSDKPEDLRSAAGRLFAGTATAYVCARAGVDPDLWGHLRFGLDLLDSRRLSSIDPYSFTQDRPWVNHEWLSELAIALAYRMGGVFGLVILKTVLVLAAVACIAAIVRSTTPRLRWWFVGATVIALAPSALTFRPQLFTLALLAAVLLCVERTRLALLPLLFAIWANVHGGWIVGFGTVGLFLAGRVLDRSDVRTTLRLALAAMLSLVATLANPYGWRLWQFLLSTVRMTREVTEWQPLWVQPDYSHQVLWILTASIVAATLVRRWRALSWARLLPVLWLGGSGLFVDRLAPLFGIAAVMVSAEGWRAEPVAAAVRPSRPLAVVAIDAVIVAAVWLFAAVPLARCLPIDDDWTPDLIAAGAMTGAQQGRLVVPFDWGEYALWHWGPGLKVSVDGRRETVYSEAHVVSQAAVVRGGPESRAYFARVKPEYAWLPQSAGPTAAWLDENGYRLDVQTPRSFVAVRDDLPPLVVNTPAPACFP